MVISSYIEKLLRNSIKSMRSALEREINSLKGNRQILRTLPKIIRPCKRSPWASKTSLEGNVEITVLQDEERVRKDPCSDTLGYLNGLDDQQRLELVKHHKDMVKLTPEGEEKATSLKEQRILLLLYVYAEWLTENFRYRICIPTIIIAVRKICLKKIESKMSDDSVIECVILTYRRSYLPERMIYNRDANFYAGFYYKDGVLTEKSEEDAFKLFHLLYSEKVDQEYEHKYGHLEKRRIRCKGGQNAEALEQTAKRDIQAYRQQDRDSDTLQCLQNG